MTRALRLSGILLAVLVALCIAAGAALYSLIASETGSRWLLTRALAMTVPDARFDTLKGTLLEGIRFQGLHLPLDGVDIRLSSLHGRWQLWDVLGGQFPIEEIAATEAVVRITPPDTEPTPHVDDQPPSWPSLAVPFPVSLKHLSIDDLTVVRVTVTDGDTVEETQHIDHIELALEAGLLHTRIHQLRLTLDDSRLSLAGRIGNRFPYPLNIDVDWQTSLDGERYRGAGQISGNLEALNLRHNLDSPYNLTTSGQLKTGFTTDSGPVLDIDGVQVKSFHNHWQELVIPAGGEEEITTSGELTLDGNWRDYRLSLQGDLRSSREPLPPLRLRLAGRGDRYNLEFTGLALESDSGTITGAGSLNWEMPLRWQLALTVEQLQVGDFAPEWPATLDASLTTKGYWQEDDYSLELAIERMRGDILDHRIRGRGGLTLDSDLLSVDDLTLSVGDNSLAVSGTLGTALDLNWRLEAPDLSAIHPDITGALHSSGSAAGALPDLVIDTHTEASRLSAFAVEARSLDLRLQPVGDERYRLKLEGNQIGAPGLPESDIHIHGTGTLRDHRLALAATSDDMELELALTGGLQGNDSWAGTLSDLVLTHPLSGDWRQRHDSELSLSPQQLMLDSLCLRQDDGSICTRLTASGEALYLSADLDNLSLDILKAWLPPAMTVDGALGGSLDLSGPYDQLTGTVELAATDTLLHYVPTGNDTAISHRADITLNGRMDNGSLAGKAHIAIADTGRLDGDIRFRPDADIDHSLDGTITGSFDNLRWLDGFFPALENLDGSLAVDLTLSGQPTEAGIAGELSFDGIGMQIPVAGIQLEAGRGALTLSPAGGWRLDAAINSGDGELAITGSGELAAPDFIYGDLSITGNQFMVANLPDFSAVVAPDIDLAMGRESIDITGTLALTDGHVTIRTMGDRGVDTSGDERLYPGEDQEQTRTRPVNARLQLRLMDSFRLSGYGLTARLGGDMQLTQRADQPPRGIGTINIYDGVYRAYGQQLNVEQGQLIFQGPLENPGLNITAVRDTPHARVGLRIGGFANDIRSEVFSDPNLPSSEAIAILVTGKPMNDMTESEANQVVNAAAALGLSQSKWVTSRLRDSFGLDVVDIQGGEDYTESAVVVGKYLTPKIFISYVQNLFTPEGSVELDYSLTSWLGVKARSGETQSLDLMFRLEHGPPREQNTDQ